MTGRAELEVEALLFAAGGPVSLEALARAMPGVDLDAVLAGLGRFWAGRGMDLKVRAGEVSLAVAPAAAAALAERQGRRVRRLSSAAVETLSFIALNQPVTLADVEKGRGVRLFRGLMESLLDAGYVRASVRRTDAGRAVCYVTTDAFLERFSLASLSDLPLPEELEELGAPTHGLEAE